MNQRLPGTALMAWLILANNLAAQTEETADTVMPAYEIHVIEVRSDRGDLPYPVSKIDRVDITANPAITMEPLLETVPGVWMQSGAPNTNRISIRGVGNRQPFATSKLKVYLGEIPLTNGIGESSIEDIDPVLYQNIEIWKSPSSALWGSGLGGMIHLDPAWEGNRKFSASLTAGSFGYWNLRLYSRFRYDSLGRHQTIVHTHRASWNGYRQNNGYNRVGLTGMHRSQISRKFDLHFFGHILRLKAGIPSSLNLTDYHQNPEIAAPNWQDVNGREDYRKGIGGIHARYMINQRWTYRAAVFGQFNPAYEVRPFNILDSRYRTAGTRHRISFSPNATTLITAGFEFSGERYAWQTYEVLEKGKQGILLTDQAEKRNQTYFFLHAETEMIPGLRTVIGMSYARTDQRLEGNRFSQSSLNPTLGLEYTFKPSGISFFSSISRGFSPIALADALQSDGTLNNDLNAEKGWSWEAGARYRSAEGRFRIQVAAYRMRIRDLYVQKRIAEDQFVGTNAGRTIHEGLEIETDWMPGSRWRFRMAYTFSGHRFGDFIDGTEDFSGNDLTGSAPHMFRNSASFMFADHTSLTLTHRFVSRVPVNDANTVYGDAFTRFDLSARTRFHFSRDHSVLQVSAGISNLFDTRYASMFQINAVAFGNASPRYYYPGLPRHWFIRFEYSLD